MRLGDGGMPLANGGGCDMCPFCIGGGGWVMLLIAGGRRWFGGARGGIALGGGEGRPPFISRL